jgi:arginyl-tRNA synthetase
VAPIIEAYPVLETTDFAFAPPPKAAMGDVAMRTFEAARKLKMPPPKLAAAIAADISFGADVVETTTAGPYVNFKLDRDTFGRRIVSAIREEGSAYGASGRGENLTALVEHTSINPNASPHVGRARNAMIGDSLVRMLRFEGYDVEVQYYVNDMGRQIALLALVCGDPSKRTFDEMLKLYVEANERAATDAAFADEAYALLAKMEDGDQETRDRMFAVTELCLHGQLMVLARLGVKYDVFVRESKYVKDPRLEVLLEALRKNNAVFTDEDARLVVDLKELGHEYDEGRYFVLMRANGSSLYGCRDLSYTIEKSERGADLNLIVLGEDHTLYAQQLKRILGTADMTAPEPVYYAYILLKEGKMSTREGKVVLLSEFLDEATKRAMEKVEDQCVDLPEKERQAIAAKVAVAAVRFAILRVGSNKNVIFDWDASLSFSGDTGPYVQYSCARIASILRKFGDLPDEVPEAFPVEKDEEWALLTKLTTFPDVIQTAVDQRAPAPVAQFALETARLFTSFYHACPVLTAETDEQQRARALICAVTLRALKNALRLIGIESLDRM